MECKHENGWVLKEEICVGIDNYNDDLEAEFECNNLDCKKRKRFKFLIDNFKEI